MQVIPLISVTKLGSGCVTSAETVLITAQSTKEFLKNVGIGKTVVVSISPQSRASLAAHFNLDTKAVCIMHDIV